MSVIEVSNLRKRYRDHVAVDDVSFTVEEGEIFGIVGPNGAGKTTTVECIEGIRRPDEGSIRVLGLDPQRDRAELRQRVGVQLQEGELPEKIKVWEVLKLYGSFYRRPADLKQLIEDLGLSDKRDAAFGTVSGGQKQRLSIALSLVGNPDIAVLDELTTGLDPQARRETWALIERIRARGVTVLLVTHFMDEAERLCDRLAVIDRGRVVAMDSPAGLLSAVDVEQCVRFRPSAPLDDHMFSAVPEVTGVHRNHTEVRVSGTGNLLHAVTSVLAHHHIIPHDMRLDQGTLDDAFVALTGRKLVNGL